MARTHLTASVPLVQQRVAASASVSETLLEFEPFAFCQLFPAAGEQWADGFGEGLDRRDGATHRAHGLAKVQHQEFAIAPDGQACRLIIRWSHAPHAKGRHPG